MTALQRSMPRLISPVKSSPSGGIDNNAIRAFVWLRRPETGDQSTQALLKGTFRSFREASPRIVRSDQNRHSIGFAGYDFREAAEQIPGRVSILAGVDECVPVAVMPCAEHCHVIRAERCVCVAVACTDYSNRTWALSLSQVCARVVYWFSSKRNVDERGHPGDENAYGACELQQTTQRSRNQA
jgi:hypothetical protein